MWLATIKTAHIRMKNCTQEQIASALGITTNTLRSILKKHKNLIENETAKSID
jgi:transcriptional regulator with XRE-family HTH domain